jgi:hypothetical protein
VVVIVELTRHTRDLSRVTGQLAVERGCDIAHSAVSAKLSSVVQGLRHQSGAELGVNASSTLFNTLSNLLDIPETCLELPGSLL